MSDSFQARSSDSIFLGVVSAGAYLIVGLFSAQIARGVTQTTPVWLASGVVFGLLISVPRAQWAPILAGSFFASAVWAFWGHGLKGIHLLLFAALETCGVIAGSLLASMKKWADAVVEAFFLIAGAFVTSVLGATASAKLWYWEEMSSAFGDEWRTWALSTGVGIVLVAPVANSFRTFVVKGAGGLPMRPFLLGLATFSMFISATLLVFGKGAIQRFGAIAPTLGYLPMPFLLATSLIWGPLGGALATLLGSLLIFRLTVEGWGPFALTDAVSGHAVVEAQSYVLIWAILIHFGQALLASRQAASRRARHWQLHCERILQASHMASVEFDAVTGRAEWGETAASVLGGEVAHLHHVSDWLQCLPSGDRAAANLEWSALANGELAIVDSTHDIRVGNQVRCVRARFAGVQGPDGSVERIGGVIWLD